MKATWSYFEAGHGKGPCDGLGGTIKRLADDTIKREVAIIQDANEFYAWATTLKSEMSFLFLTKEECEAATVALEELCTSTRTIQGTMMIHAVSYASASTDGVGIMVRNTSCVVRKMCCGTLRVDVKVHKIRIRIFTPLFLPGPVCCSGSN